MYYLRVNGRHVEYSKLPKGDRFTPSWNYSHRPYRIIINREQNLNQTIWVEQIFPHTKKAVNSNIWLLKFHLINTYEMSSVDVMHFFARRKTGVRDLKSYINNRNRIIYKTKWRYMRLFDISFFRFKHEMCNHCPPVDNMHEGIIWYNSAIKVKKIKAGIYIKNTNMCNFCKTSQDSFEHMF